MAYTSLYGTLTSRSQVKQAVVNLLSQPPTNANTGLPASASPMLVYYLAELERQMGLNPHAIPIPPGPASYRVGIDFETWKADDSPLLIVNAQPSGDAVPLTSLGEYVQSYQIQVAAIVESADGDQDEVGLLADLYGTAIMGALIKNGNLGTRTTDAGVTEPFALKTRLISAPRTEFQSPTNRRFARSVTIVESLIPHIVDESGP